MKAGGQALSFAIALSATAVWADPLILLDQQGEVRGDEGVLVQAYQATVPMQDAEVGDAIRAALGDAMAGDPHDFIFVFVYPVDLTAENLEMAGQESTFAAYGYMTKDSATAGWVWNFYRHPDDPQGTLQTCGSEWEPGCHFALRGDE
ncbi:hypothetical protein [Octadecabacter sp. R77987]|uniref:hypothetical protein n=1 Tax=Octadecabacter sp. R77987 TaxID=3093874 RepID=UPI00366CA3D0